MTRIVVVSPGAWDQWRDEVRAKLRGPDEPHDALFFAAMCDANGLDRLDEYRDTGTETLIRLAAMWFEESEILLREHRLNVALTEAA
jgi:hypothetical protein